MTRPSVRAAAAGEPVITRSHVSWTAEHRFEAGAPGRFVTIDADAETAPGPVEMLLGAVAACSAVDVIDILAKRRTPVTRFSIDVVGERRSEHPRRLTGLELTYHIEGPGIEAVHAEHAIQLAFERYCSVGASLAPDIDSRTVLVLNGVTRDPVRRVMWTPPR